MQKLQAKFENAPRNASLVPCSVSSSLNKEEIPSVMSIVRTCNNSEENHQQHRAGSGLRVLNVVYVLNKRGEALMPTCQAKARRLVRNGKAKIVRRFPFTIQLKTSTGEAKKEISLGIDSGYGHIGFSAVTNNKELIAGEVIVDNKTGERLIEKSMYRRGRRNKLWYRKPRFDNRNTPEGWLPPSVQRRYDLHVRLIKRIGGLLPITIVTVETGNFDIQKIENPDIQGKEYQQGATFGYFNVKSFILAREHGKCQICGREKSNDVWAVHHIVQRKNAGTDKPSNLALLHKGCHKKLHRQGSKLVVKDNKTYKPSTFMNIVRNRFINDLNCETTFGYITYGKRIALGLEKSHVNDAFVIAGGEKQKRCSGYSIEQKRKNNRSLQLNRKGFKPAIRRQRYSCQPKDLVKVGKKIFEVVGTHCCGKSIMVWSGDVKKSIPVKRIGWHYHFSGMVWGNKVA